MAVSSNFAPTYKRAGLMDVVTNLEGKHQLDTLSQKYIDIFRYLNNYTNVVYTGQQLTTLSYRYYGTTTLWWLILMYNGYYHWMEIELGSALKIPAKQDIDAYITRRDAASLKGKQVTI